MTTPAIPADPVEDRPAGFHESTEQGAVLRDTLLAAGIELGTYEADTLHWLSRWDWATVSVVASWVARAAATRPPAAPVALPARFTATPADIDQHLRRILAEDTYLAYQRAIGGCVVAEAVDEVHTTDLPDDYIDMFDKGAGWAADLIDPAKGGGPYPSQLQCSQHDGFGPCPGAPRCTPAEPASEDQ